MTQREECQHRTSSSCTTSWGEWSLSVQFQSPERPTPGQTPENNNKKINKQQYSRLSTCHSLTWTAWRAHLTKIHDDALVNLLPQVSSEDLNEGDLQCRDLAVHEDSCQIKLHLETNVHLQTRQQNC